MRPLGAQNNFVHLTKKRPLEGMVLAYTTCDFIGWLPGTKLKFNPFAVKMVTMHRWFRIDIYGADN